MRFISFNDLVAKFKPFEVNDEKLMFIFTVWISYLNNNIDSIIEEREEILNAKGWEGSQADINFRRLESDENNLVYKRDKIELIKNQLVPYMTVSIEAYPKNHLYKLDYSDVIPNLTAYLVVRKPINENEFTLSFTDSDGGLYSCPVSRCSA